MRYGSAAGGVRVEPGGAAFCRVAGQSAPGNTLELDGSRVPLDGSGRFSVELPLDRGERVLGLVLRGDGCLRLLNLQLSTTGQPPLPGGER